MKMREEIDALSVIGLDPVDVLVFPRLVALVIACRCLTFLADIAAMFGGVVVAWIYAGISPEVFLDAAADGDRPRHISRRPDQGAVHGADHRHHRLASKGLKVRAAPNRSAGRSPRRS